jgi:hypothetical protein
MLRSRQYVQLTKLAGEVISKAPPDVGRYEVEFGVRVRNEVEALMARSDFENAGALIDTALAMDPPLPERFTADLRRYKGQVDPRRRPS